eukprot:1645637-Amphidinium_carterae.1
MSCVVRRGALRAQCSLSWVWLPHSMYVRVQASSDPWIALPAWGESHPGRGRSLVRAQTSQPHSAECIVTALVVGLRQALPTTPTVTSTATAPAQRQWKACDSSCPGEAWVGVTMAARLWFPFCPIEWPELS